ncbi:MAG: hypothetical protein EXS24_02870 [Pedosphaera sp.]|nr:hypothetical protein [Pedosphaera sp.]
MRLFFTLGLLTTAYIAVFLGSADPLFCPLLNITINPLIPLITVVGCQCRLSHTFLVALFGSLWQTSLSSDPLALNLLPLFSAGYFFHEFHGRLNMRDPFTKFVFGALAHISVQSSTLLLLLTLGHTPAIEWGLLWQWILSSVVTGLLTIVAMPYLNWLNRAF